MRATDRSLSHRVRRATGSPAPSPASSTTSDPDVTARDASTSRWKASTSGTDTNVLDAVRNGSTSGVCW